MPTNMLKRLFNEDCIIFGSATYMFIYIGWVVILSIIDIMVCSIIFYQTYLIKRTYYHSYVQQLYSLPNMEYILSHWLLVYGATSVTKLVTFVGLLINPILIFIINSWLYVSTEYIDDTLNEQCRNQTYSVTCQVFNNPEQYQRLKNLNQIQLFGSIIVIGLIPIVLFLYVGIIVLSYIPEYIYTIVVRFHELLCCRCYTRTCKNMYYIFCYIFCYGPNPTSKSNVSDFKSNNKNIIDII